MEWALLPLKRYAEFSGRSRRKEYWLFVLLLIPIYIAAMAIDFVIGLNTVVVGLYGPFYLLTALALLVPSIAVGVRRLHDIDKSGWWLLITLIPLIGAIVLLVFACTAGTAGPNRFGPDPKQPDLGEVFA